MACTANMRNAEPIPHQTPRFTNQMNAMKAGTPGIIFLKSRSWLPSTRALIGIVRNKVPHTRNICSASTPTTNCAATKQTIATTASTSGSQNHSSVFTARAAPNRMPATEPAKKIAGSRLTHISPYQSTMAKTVPRPLYASKERFIEFPQLIVHQA